MMHSEGRDRIGPSLEDAETLVGSLVGVAKVEVRAAADGTLGEIVVVPNPEASDHQVSRNVTSALMACFGYDLDPSAISITPPGADTSAVASDGSASLAAEPVAAGNSKRRAGVPVRSNAGPVESGPDELSGDRISTASLNGEQASGADAANATSDTATVPPVSTQRRRFLPVEGAARPRLELAELQRTGNVLRCRVVIATASERFTGVADALETQAQDIDLAARVTVDALRAARTPRQPIQFEGASLIDVSGRAHVVVSLSLWTGHDFEPIAGAEPIYASPAEAAAQAVISSITARLIT